MTAAPTAATPKVAEREMQVCPGCNVRVPQLRRHVKRCCPQFLPERAREVSPEEREAARREACGEECWISDAELREAARRSVEEMPDPLLRRVLHLRFGLDRGSPRTPAEVADELGGKFRGRPEAAFTLIRAAQRSIPMVADDFADLHIIFEDDHLLAVSKPPLLRTMPVHRFIGKSLTNQVLGYMRNKADGQSHHDGPMLLHRLDLTTSGVVLFARTKAAASFMQREWHGSRFRKQYLALAVPGPGVEVSGVGDSIVVRAPIGSDTTSDDPVRRAVNFEGGQSAATRIEVLATGAIRGGGPRVLLLSCILEEAGRTHQIRVHATHAGLPLVGDDMYGGLTAGADGLPPDVSEMPARVALHAWRLRAPRLSGEELLLVAPLPEDMRRFMEACGISPESLAKVATDQA